MVEGKRRIPVKPVLLGGVLGLIVIVGCVWISITADKIDRDIGLETAKYTEISPLPPGQATVTPETDPATDDQFDAVAERRPEDQGRKVSLQDDIAVGTGKPDSPAVDTTDGYIRHLELDLMGARNLGHLLPGDLPVTRNDCVTDWVMTNLSSYSGKSAHEMTEVCGFTAVVIAGHGEIGMGELIYKATVPGGAPKDVAAFITSPNTDPLLFASAQSADKGTGLMVLALAPKQAPSAEVPAQ